MATNGIWSGMGNSFPIDPDATHGAAAGFSSLFVWVNSVTNKTWVCVSNTPGAAVWVQVGLPPYAVTYRQVADRCDVPTSSGGAIPAGKTVRTKHVYYGRTPTNTLKVGFPNFFLTAGVTGETLGAADTTLQCAIEVNGSPGTYVDFTFSASTTVTPGAANHVISDATNIGFTLNYGDAFFMRTVEVSPTSSIFCENVRGSAAGVQDEWVLAGNFLHGGEGTGVRGTGGGRWPGAILAQSGYSAWLEIGDSKGWGQNEAKEGDGLLGHRGWATKWITERLGCGVIRMGKSGDKAQNVAGVNGRPKCIAFTKACGITHALIAPLGINDLLNSQTPAQAVTSLKSIATRFKDPAQGNVLVCVCATTEPRSGQIVGGADWSLANQQDFVSGTWAGDAGYATFNDTVRGFTTANSGYDMVLEVADIVTPARNVNRWADATPTSDGVHELNGTVHATIANALPGIAPS